MNALSRFDTQALSRALVGFDRLFDQFESRYANQLNNNYPPFNIVKTGEDSYFVELAVAGFKKDEIHIEVESDQLTIKGEKLRNDDDSWQYLHRGLSARNFVRQYQLADHMIIKGAQIQDGILRIDIERVVPEDKKTKIIDIVEVK
jgi:molecular chaperone IbpA